MVLPSTEKAVLGSIAFAIFWVLAVFPAAPFLSIGRTAGALLGAMLMVIFRVMTPEEAYAAIDLQILGLLFGTMVVSIYLERADMFKYLGILLSWKSKGAKDLLCRVCIVSAISSALFTNDTSCVVLTEFILKIARQNNLPPHPFLLAFASSANIGSSATPIGNPQNLVIAIKSKISFGAFFLGILPAMAVGVFVNALILLSMYWRLLSIEKDDENALDEMIFSEADATSHRFSPATMSRVTSLNSQDWNSMSETTTLWSSPDLSRSSPNLSASIGHVELPLNSIILSESNMQGASISVVESTRTSSAEDMGGDNFVQIREESLPSRRSARSALSGRLDLMNVSEDAMSVQSLVESSALSERWRRMLWKAYIYLVTIGMLIAFLMGLNMSWTAVTAALTLVVIDFNNARLCLEKVSYSLLVFFCGMFITMKGFDKTGIPDTLWNLIEPYARVNHASGIAVLALVILVLSNIFSNVPTVLLLGLKVAASAAGEQKKAWLILAWVSTVAGNLSLLGSAANLIVCEQARNSKYFAYTLSFWNHLKFGIPSTLIVTAIGLTLIRG